MRFDEPASPASVALAPITTVAHWQWAWKCIPESSSVLGVLFHSCFLVPASQILCRSWCPFVRHLLPARRLEGPSASQNDLECPRCHRLCFPCLWGIQGLLSWVSCQTEATQPESADVVPRENLKKQWLGEGLAPAKGWLEQRAPPDVPATPCK